MTESEAIDEMRDWQGEGDWEICHSQAGKILCLFLISLGYNRLVEEYEKVVKYYG